MPIPIIGVVHNDRELGLIDTDHIHVDRRFVSDNDLVLCGFARHGLDDRNAVPALNVATIEPEELQVFELPRVCLTDEFPQYRSFKAGWVGSLAAEARHIREVKGITHLNMDCKVCPHKGTRLDNIKPCDGVILCPAHGMEFDAVTGEILNF